MKITKDLYQSNLALLTDFYQLTMAYAYWKAGKGEQEAVFNLFFRKNPFEGGFTLAAGLDYVVDYCKNLRFESGELEYLRKMKQKDGSAMFEAAFLNYLKDLRFTCDIDAVEEGTVVFPNAPMVQVDDAKDGSEIFYEDLNYENTKALLEQLKAGKKPKAGPQSGRHTSEPAGGRTTLKGKVA
jgi:hypothetical protein